MSNSILTCDKDVVYNGSLKKGEYQYCAYTINNPSDNITIKVTASKGEADLYASYETDFPCREECTWYSQALGINQIQINNKNFEFKTDLLHFSIFAPNYEFSPESCEYTFSISNSETATLVDPVLSDSKLCTNWYFLYFLFLYHVSLRHVPNTSFNMHELSCARNNYYCKDCNLVVSNKELKKHHLLAHIPLKCSCNVDVLQSNLRNHKLNECINRLILCRYCPLKFKHVDLITHQELCRLRSVLCLHCNQSLKAQGILIHI